MKRPEWARVAFVAVVAVLFVSAQVQAWTGPSDTPGGHVVESMLAAGVTLPLLLLRRWPLSAFLVTVGSAFATSVLDSHLGQPWFALLLALYGLGNRAGTTAAVVGSTVTAVGTLWIDLPRLRDGADFSEVVPAWFIMAGAFGFGRWMRHRAEEQSELLTRAERLQADHAARVAEIVAEERAQIARELHDLVAHALAVIVVQAQAGARVVGSDPAQATLTLAAIEGVGREGLVELRRLLDLLDPVAGNSDASRPSLAQLEELAGRVRTAGVPVELVVTGKPTPLPPGLDLSAYRIVQEALTNTIKHAGPASSRVAVHYRPERLELEVTDDGRSARSTNGHEGRGLIGMRERAALYGGSLLAERPADGGFRVRASFPLGAS